jgi:hypothetical protein
VQSAGTIPLVGRARIASGDDRDRRHCLDHGGQQDGKHCRTPQVPPCLQPLGDDPLDAGLYGRLRLLNRPDLGENMVMPRRCASWM